jgi:uncharacterized protein YndB with AHSA1/START domain
MAELDAGVGTANLQLVMARNLAAPPERVFDAFTDRAHIGQWWGPNGCTTTVDEMEVRPGGVWRFTMQGADGSSYRNQVRYIAVERPARLCYEHGDGTSPHFTTEMSFEEQGSGTRVTLRFVCKTAAQLEEMKQSGVEEGGNQTLERLERYLAGYGSEM